MFLLCLLILIDWGGELNAAQDYVVNHHHVDVTYINKQYIKYYKLTNTKYNRTTRTFGITFETLVDANKLITHLQMYAFNNNHYIILPGMQMNLDYCVTMDKNRFGYGDLVMKKINMTKCPLKAGIYYGKDILPNEDMLPPHLPHGTYKLIFTMYNDETVKAVTFEWYGSIDPPPLNNRKG